MLQSQVMKYYSQPEIQNAILSIAKDREVVGTYRTGHFSKRPDIISYPNDIVERIRKDIVAFHCSIEKWKTPMQLSPNLSQNQLDELRKGWDFLIDIDSKTKFEHSKIAACAVCDFLIDFGIKPTIKFSGRRGFHIAISSDAFPQEIDYKPLAKKYPATPQAIANFIREKIKDKILEGLISYEGGVASLTKLVKNISELSPYAFVEIEKDWGSRHLFRAPFSLNEKTWLVSLPIRLFKLKKFKPEDAKPEKVKVEADFLKNKEEEATELLLQSLDWHSKHKVEEKIEKPREFTKSKQPILEDYFPPCIKNILSGIRDGRKRSLFTLASFLRAMNWDEEKIEKRMKEWNSKNRFPLNERYLKTQLKWHFRQNRNILPANCFSEIFYTSIGVCQQDPLCKKNPVNYPYNMLRKMKSRQR